MNNKAEIFLIKFEDETLGEIMGCDLRITDPTATLADFLEALDQFAADNLADCRGCDACCQERAPLIAADIPALAALLPDDPYPVHAVCRAFAEVTVEDGVADITLRRDHDNMCNRLDREGRFCTVWPSRLFVCRSHFCLPRSDRFHELRSQIVNSGENELTRLLLAEEANGAMPLTPLPLCELLDPADYPPNEHTGRYNYDLLPLRECLEPELWQQLTCYEQ